VFAFSVAACFEDPIVSRPLGAFRELDPAHFRSSVKSANVTIRQRQHSLATFFDFFATVQP